MTLFYEKMEANILRKRGKDTKGLHQDGEHKQSNKMKNKTNNKPKTKTNTNANIQKSSFPIENSNSHPRNFFLSSTNHESHHMLAFGGHLDQKFYSQRSDYFFPSQHSSIWLLKISSKHRKEPSQTYQIPSGDTSSKVIRDPRHAQMHKKELPSFVGHQTMNKKSGQPILSPNIATRIYMLNYILFSLRGPQ